MSWRDWRPNVEADTERALSQMAAENQEADAAERAAEQDFADYWGGQGETWAAQEEAATRTRTFEYFPPPGRTTAAPEPESELEAGW